MKYTKCPKCNKQGNKIVTYYCHDHGLYEEMYSPEMKTKKGIIERGSISTKKFRHDDIVAVGKPIYLDNPETIYEAGFSTGLLEGEKRMLDKAIECVPSRSFLWGKVMTADELDDQVGWNQCREEVLSSLQALKNN